MQGFKFSKVEISHLLRAWILISIAFAIVLRQGSIFAPTFLYYLLIAAITVGFGFLIHELSHKYFAQRYGCWAEFRSDPLMLLLALMTSFFGVIFAAPGAVIIQGTVTTKRNGVISTAGPATNVVLAAIFFLLTFVSTPFISELGKYGLLINAWLAVFNLIPFGNIDGAKVFRWNKAVYFAVLALGIGFLVLSFVWK